MKNFTLVLLLVAALFAKVEGAPKRVGKMKRILVLGDSLTAGFGLARSQAYPALLAAKMRGLPVTFEITNAGASGDTTGGALQRLPDCLQRQVDILIIELGINDAFRGIPVEQMRMNLQAIIDKTRARFPKVEIVIAGMQLPMYVNDPYVKEFGEMYSALAEKNHAALVPFLLKGVGGDPTLNQHDRVHPNAAGQRVLAENIWEVLEPIVRRMAEREKN